MIRFHRLTLAPRAASLGLVLVLFSASACAVTLQMVSGYPDGNFLTKTVRAFIADVYGRTNGAVKIILHNNQTLVKLPDMIRAVQTNQVALADIRLGNYGNDDAMYTLDAIPYLAGDYDKALALWHASKPYLVKSFAHRGLKVLFAMWNPPQGFYTEMPLVVDGDFKSLKLRIYSVETQRMGELLGAQPKEVPFSEVALAFSTGLINAMFTSPQTGIDTQAWDFTRNLTMVGALFTKQLVSINQNVFTDLSKEQQQAILLASAKAEKRGFELMKSTTGHQLALIKRRGMMVREANSAIKHKLETVGARMIDSWKAKAGPEQVGVLDNFIKTRNHHEP